MICWSSVWDRQPELGLVPWALGEIGGERSSERLGRALPHLNSEDVRGGALNDVSFALNWYPTPHVKMSFNTIRAARKGWDPVWVFQGRLQVRY